MLKAENPPPENLSFDTKFLYQLLGENMKKMPRTSEKEFLLFMLALQRIIPG